MFQCLTRNYARKEHDESRTIMLALLLQRTQSLVEHVKAKQRQVFGCKENALHMSIKLMQYFIFINMMFRQISIKISIGYARHATE